MTDKKAQPGFEIELGGERVRFILNLNSLKKLKYKLKEDFKDPNYSLVKWLETFNEFDIEHVSYLFWAGLTSAKPGITIEESDEMADLIDLYNARGVVIEAFERAMPGAKEKIDDFLQKSKGKNAKNQT